MHRRNEPFFSILVDVHYRGQTSLQFDSGTITLQFLKHFQVVQSSLDPDDFAQKIQSDADALDHETAREVEKHPEKKEGKDAYVRTYQKESAELLEFVSKDSLRAATLTPANAEASGWVLFSTSSKWISGWKKQEDFILRVPVNGTVFEFPFTLPPKPGEAILRKRK